MEIVMHHERTLYGEDDDQGVPRPGLADLARRTYEDIGALMARQDQLAKRAEAWNRLHSDQRYKGKLWSGFLALAVLAGLLISKLQ